jgi:hypothetical protein
VSDMRKPTGFDVIDGDLPQGMGSLSQRIANITTTLDGTPEQPEIGLISRVKSVESFQRKLMDRLNLWGGVLLGSFALSGIMNGKAAAVVHTIITGVIGVG